MFDLSLFSFVLILATLFTMLATGLVFTFALVTMPGIKILDDREFIRAFQAMDGVIQNGHPLFGLVWIGSIVMLIGATVIGFGQLAGALRWSMISATAIYLFGVQLPTIVINIPLNNELQTLDVDSLDAGTLKAARDKFEARWNQSNVFRSTVAVVVTILLMFVMLGT